MNPTHVVVEGQLKPDGTLQLDGKVALPPGRVRVTVEASPPEAVPSNRPMTLAEQFSDVIGILSDLPADFAENHDHYLHGTPKK